MPINIGGGISIGGSVNLGRFVLPDPEVPQPSFPNPDFEYGLDGWTAYNNDVYWAGSTIGSTTLAGYPTPVLPDPLPYANQGQQNFDGWITYIPTYTTTVSTDIPNGSTGKSVVLKSDGGAVRPVGATVYGPAIFSNYIVTFDAGDSCAFNWRAVSVTDAYSIYAYMINVDTGAVVSLLRDTAPDVLYPTIWRSRSVVVSTAGDYKFVFVAGCWDATLGRAVGAEFRINNIRRIAQ